MNILFIVPYTPNNIRTRSRNFIQQLKKAGHQVTVMTIWANENEKADLQTLEQDCHQVFAKNLPTWRSAWNCLKALPSDTPLQMVYSWEPNLAKLILDLAVPKNGASDFDLIHIEHLRGAKYGVALKEVQSQSGYQIPIVWDSVDSISLLFRQAIKQSASIVNRSITRFELGRTERSEGKLLSMFDHVLVTSNSDRQALLELNPGETCESLVSVIPNGVDLDYFKPDRDQSREKATLVLSGKMSYHANITMVSYFIENIMPRIWERNPDVWVWIVGKDPSEKIQALGRHPNIVVTGTVPDIRPYLQKATLAVVPLTYGAGIQNKVLEAMACATPVVATSQVQSGIEARPGEDFIIADEPESFTEKVLNLLDDPTQQAAIGCAGRQFVENKHDWRLICTQLEDIYRQVLEKHPKTELTHMG